MVTYNAMVVKVDSYGIAKHGIRQCDGVDKSLEYILGLNRPYRLTVKAQLDLEIHYYSDLWQRPDSNTLTMTQQQYGA